MQTTDATCDRLRRDGYVRLSRRVEPERLKRIAETIDGFIATGTNVRTPVSVAQLETKQLTTSAVMRGGVAQQAAIPYVDRAEVEKGPSHYRHLTNGVGIADPLLNVPDVFDIAFDPVLVEIASRYLGAAVRISFVKIRRTFANDLPDYDQNFFHVDDNSQKLLKAIVYLNDVDPGGGPFCYVTGSQGDRFAGWDSKVHWTLEEMERAYGRERIATLTGSPGDVILTDTIGFHRGAKPERNDRTALFVNYVLEPEYGGKGERTRIARSAYDRLTGEQRKAAAFLEIVGA